MLSINKEGCMCIFSFLKGAHLVFVIMEKSRASCFSGPHCTQPAAACGMSLRPAGCLSSPCVEFGRQPMPVMRGRGWWFGKQKARCDWEGKQLAFWGASDKLSGREAPTAARSQGGLHAFGKPCAPTERVRVHTSQGVCGTADQGALQSLGKQILKTETEESRLGENGLPGWAGEPPHCSLPRHRRGRSKRPRCSQDGDGRKASLSSEDWKGLRDKAMRTPFSRGQAGLSQTRPNSNPFRVRFRNLHFWRVPVGFRELTEGGVDAAEDRRSLVKGNIRNEDFLTAPAGARSFSGLLVNL